MSSMRVHGTLEGEGRRQQLTERLARSGSLSLSQEARRFGVHEMTMRRDLDALERDGLARRVRGGAVLPQGDAFSLRMQRAQRAKRQIAQKLKSLVPTTGAIGVDASTTLVHLARDITGNGLSVVTNGMATFDELRRRPGIRSFLTGGESEELNASLVGSLAIQSVKGFHLDRIFLSAASINPDAGTSETTPAQVDVKRAMAAVANRVVVAVDSSKLDTTSPVRALSLPEIDILVTELNPSDSRLDEYRETVELY
ncbi:MAG: DeoR/GlpR transcriptional regulator [Microbacteriaceae bacterium]|nr:DeoR/GlpR transcriptional regulator [Microbacteriaceae bacterium]